MEDLSSCSFLTDLRHCGDQLASGKEFDLNSTCIKQHCNLNFFAGEVHKAVLSYIRTVKMLSSFSVCYRDFTKVPLNSELNSTYFWSKICWLYEKNSRSPNWVKSIFDALYPKVIDKNVFESECYFPFESSFCLLYLLATHHRWLSPGRLRSLSSDN